MQNNDRPPQNTINKLNFINANARSLGRKLISLADCFEEKSLTLCTLTETWFKNDDNLSKTLDDFENEYGITAIVRNRPQAAANGANYGGLLSCAGRPLVH